MDSLFSTAFTAWGAPTTWLELIAVVVALAMVACNIRQIHWGWPLAIISSVMYFAIFWHSKLYGEATLQVFFAVVALWGWWQWLRGVRPDGSALKVSTLNPSGTIKTIAASAVFTWATALFLIKYTDSDVPWLDAFPTALSVVGQFLLGRKFLENWLVWLVVNLASVGLFTYKGLWLTVGLYAVFAVLSVWGWVQWKRTLHH